MGCFDSRYLISLRIAIPSRCTENCSVKLLRSSPNQPKLTDATMRRCETPKSQTAICESASMTLSETTDVRLMGTEFAETTKCAIQCPRNLNETIYDHGLGVPLFGRFLLGSNNVWVNGNVGRRKNYPDQLARADRGDLPNPGDLEIHSHRPAV
jgi:hypothetical protein